ncbi:HAD family acid phosphatase [Mycoplasmopsis bovis]|uniref:HAD family acid phosphatase n=8 Tax=Mycoplasmopsis bovis TaxID=28903 RepID=A0A2N8U247_MYCBV|nr:HAD family acid phosphatase [Mycoplasmopsis bovis]ADR25120.1 putative lipoprotein, HAD-superfamily hydrolase, subfamily IIIB [Mycoplasmopsis bovis PG45]AEI90017.1 conserved hypothetical protein [Mycoplasmopsis bovis Hubei-1]AFM51694.1 putative secreted acid phosphatase [Mycoplasmopsis bovis HB0801]AIA33891.1 secreted acid phosphatase [Mycoplasmopsis bovis CQ-W70]AKO50518.1 hypothetical protein AAV31_01640 [Mycoplasmopsis bovis]
MTNRKFFKGMLIGSAPVILLPTIAATCENTATKSDQKDNKIYENTKLNTVLSSLKSTWETLKDNEKHDAIKTIAKAMKSDVKLSDDEVHYLISELNKDVGTFGGVVWYISSVESLIGKEQSYKFAKLAFDKLKESNKDKIDFGKKFMDNTSKIEADSNKSLPVVFMDIDETVLQNDLTEASAMINGGYSGATKEKNDLKANRFAIPGAVEFINYVHENGGLVFYNSDMNQSTAVRDAVKENLKKVGVKFVQDFQFWMRGSMPYLAENEAEISDEKTKDLSDDSLKKLANKLKFTTEYRETPWITWTNSSAAYRLGKKVYKTDRMEALDKNNEGFKLMGDKKVPLKTIMKIGDNYNDFFDRISKGKTNKERVDSYRSKELEINKYFDINGADVKHTVKKDNKYTLEKVPNPWKQVYVLVPGNAEYGGWLDKLGYGNVYNLYKEILNILKNTKYQEGPKPENNVI